MAATDTDDEIDSIMNEIEELQKEMSPDPATAVTHSERKFEAAPAAVSSEDAEVDDILSEIQASGRADKAEAGVGTESAGLEDTLSEIKADMASNGLLDETEVNEEEIMPKETQGSDGTLSLTLSGNMTLKLKYEFEGQEVAISFADQALRVQMTDGTEFKVPMGRVAAQPSNVKPFKKAV